MHAQSIAPHKWHVPPPQLPEYEIPLKMEFKRIVQKNKKVLIGKTYQAKCQLHHNTVNHYRNQQLCNAYSLK